VDLLPYGSFPFLEESYHLFSKIKTKKDDKSYLHIFCLKLEQDPFLL